MIPSLCYGGQPSMMADQLHSIHLSNVSRCHPVSEKKRSKRRNRIRRMDCKVDLSTPPPDYRSAFYESQSARTSGFGRKQHLSAFQPHNTQHLSNQRPYQQFFPQGHQDLDSGQQRELRHVRQRTPSTHVVYIPHNSHTISSNEAALEASSSLEQPPGVSEPQYNWSSIYQSFDYWCFYRIEQSKRRLWAINQRRAHLAGLHKP